MKRIVCNISLTKSFGSDKGLRKLQSKYEAFRTLSMLEKLNRFGMIDRKI